MTWKSDLQESNSRLDFFMSLQDGTEPGLLAELEKQRVLIDEALAELKGKVTPHLPMEGQFVWKKYDKQPYTISFTVKPFTPSPHTLIAKSAQIDLTKVTASFFDGIGGDFTVTGAEKGSYEFTSGGTILKIFDGTNNFDFPCTYDPSTTEFSVESASSIGDVNSFSDYYSGAAYICYATDDRETVFPDGGEKDGYWYERIPVVTKQGVFVNDDVVVIRLKIVPNRCFQDTKGDYLLRYVKNLVVETDKISERAFFGIWNDDYLYKKKAKCKVKEIDVQAFAGASDDSTMNSAFWISKDCQAIKTNNSYQFAPWTGRNENTRIYCEHESKPAGFNSQWNYRGYSSQLTVTWGVTEAEFDSL